MADAPQNGAQWHFLLLIENALRRFVRQRHIGWGEYIVAVTVTAALLLTALSTLGGSLSVTFAAIGAGS